MSPTPNITEYKGMYILFIVWSVFGTYCEKIKVDSGPENDCTDSKPKGVDNHETIAYDIRSYMVLQFFFMKGYV